MTFLEILQSSLTDLPICQNQDSFLKTIKHRLDEFGKVIDQSYNLSGPINNSDFTPDIFKKRNKIIRDGIISTLEAYYREKPKVAYDHLKEFMEKAGRSYLEKENYLPMNSNFFRIRVQAGNFALPKKELFHIPFDKRGKVKTQRYSIPGLPSLYLSNSIYVAWEEMRRPGFDLIQAVRLSNKRDLQVLDLTTDIYNKNDHLTDNHAYGWQLLYKVMTWPLVAACSVKVKIFDDPFKPEYIIPQLLLQWINTSMLDGIMYSSTHINPRENGHNGHFYNVVLPVKTFDKEDGYCTALSDIFQSTQVVPMQLRQFISSSDRFNDQGSITTDVNPAIKELELIKGNSQYYSSTYFGILEHSLNYLPLEDIC